MKKGSRMKELNLFHHLGEAPLFNEHFKEFVFEFVFPVDLALREEIQGLEPGHAESHFF